MAISFDNSDDFFGGDSQRLAEKGDYHLFITLGTEQPTMGNGALIAGAVLQLKLTVAAGPHKDKTVDLTYFGLKADASAKAREWFNRKLIRLAYAMGLIGNKEIMSKIPPVDYSQAKGRQVIMSLDFGTKEDGSKKEFLEMVFANVWHVDDPAAPKEAVRDAAMIGMLPAQLRRTPEYFAELRKFEEAKKVGGNGQSTRPTNTTTQPTNNVAVEELV